MEKRFDHKKVEGRIYEMWEKGGYFKPRNLQSGKKPFTIVLPPPNASGKMHIGNVLMIAIEDLMIRWHRMKGEPTVWIPGTDHAGFETQITFERELQKKGKSRLDYDRQSLYEMIWEFVQKNKGLIEEQIRAMGASVDWSRYTFTLDPHVIETVYKTFEKMYKDGLIYRDDYLVNYCPKCGTTFADLEIKYQQRQDPFYYVRYPLLDRKKGEPEYLVVATVRPETIMIDTHLAVHPKDQKNKHWIGRKVKNPLTGRAMEIIGDRFVNPEFGTGIVKLTPGHDKHDWEVGRQHNLPVVSMLDMKGRVTKAAGEKYAGLSVEEARKKVVSILKEAGLIDRVEEDYEHKVAVCYKGGHVIEPMVLPNWFVKVESLKKAAYEAVKKGKVKIFPKWQEITYYRWMEEMRDWPISRQVVWGIRIPVWYKIKGERNQQIRVVFKNKKGKIVRGEIGELSKQYSVKEIKAGLQSLLAPKGAEFIIQSEDPGDDYLPETDTFDTWFSSGHWPLVTLHYPDGEDFKRFYPTSVLETGWEIIRFWVSRMIMLGIYLTGKVPFEYVYLHGLVRAIDGRKMSKSLGNVINPEEYMDKYGVDALRMGLISGTATGKDFNFPHDKVVAYRNFANKLWNMARFINIMFTRWKKKVPQYKEIKAQLKEEDKKIINELKKIIKEVEEDLKKFRFAQGGEKIYHFLWDKVANEYIEVCKKREDKDVSLAVLREVFKTGMKLLHPFMPFVTEAIWEYIPDRKEKEPLIISQWPRTVDL